MFSRGEAPLGPGDLVEVGLLDPCLHTGDDGLIAEIDAFRSLYFTHMQIPDSLSANQLINQLTRKKMRGPADAAIFQQSPSDQIQQVRPGRGIGDAVAHAMGLDGEFGIGSSQRVAQ